jgi:hypothetical protein
MQSFIVLGIIPGTSVQLTFTFWMYTSVFVACTPLLRATWRRRSQVHGYIVGFMISRVIAQYQLPA